MAKSVTVVRWLDDLGFEHTTEASAEYEITRNKVLKLLNETGLEGTADNIDIVEFIASHTTEVDAYIKATLKFRNDLGLKVGKHYS